MKVGDQDARQVVVIGAGIGGLAAALDLAARGEEVLVLERAAAPGGKIRQVTLGDGPPVAAGPALLTSPAVFEALFDAAGTTLGAHVALERLTLLSRNAWDARTRLDLPADPRAAAEAIGAFTGSAREARGFLDLLERARRVHATLERSFLQAARPPTPAALVARAGLGPLLGIAPFAPLDSVVAEHLADPRLRQLFGRMAAYVGASPYRAPASLLLVAHVEQQGVHRVAGGMVALVQAMARLLAAKGGRLRTGAEVREILVRGGRAAGVRLVGGEALAARAVVANVEPAAIAKGWLGAAVAPAVPAPPSRAARSFSAIAWAMRARVSGPLVPGPQTVAHAPDSRAEYDDLVERQTLPAAPSVTLWAEDRGPDGTPPAEGAEERLLLLVHAPARGDTRPLPPAALERAEQAAFARLAACGVALAPVAIDREGPTEFERRFPGSGGALYGAATHGWQSSFARPGARTRLPGLYLAGGACHPGAGVAMAALSGRRAAAAVMEDRRR